MVNEHREELECLATVRKNRAASLAAAERALNRGANKRRRGGGAGAAKRSRT